MRYVLVVLLISSLAGGPSIRAPQAAQSGLEAGIQQVKDGHFDAALLTLDAVVRQLRNDPARSPELVRAYVYLGAAYVGLQQESPARENFKEALKLDKALQLDPNEFPPRVVRVFEATRKGKSKSAMYAGGGIGTAAIIAGVVLLGGASAGSVQVGGETTTTTTTTTSTTTTTTLPRGIVPGPGVTFAHEFLQRGQVTLSRILLNGAPVLGAGEGVASGDSRLGRNVIEGIVLDAHGQPGVWRFSLRRGFQAGTLQALEGQPVEITPESIAFGLSGRSGERVAFTFLAEPE